MSNLSTKKMYGNINTEISLRGNIKTRASLSGNLRGSKIYPALENLNIKPSEVQQIFKHPNSYGYDEVIVEAVEIATGQCDKERWYIEHRDVWDGNIVTDLPKEQVEAVQNMILTLTDDLVLEYDDKTLDVTFTIKDNDLIVENNVEELDFYINKKKELEAIY